MKEYLEDVFYKGCVFVINSSSCFVFCNNLFVGKRVKFNRDSRYIYICAIVRMSFLHFDL